jgi:hypothetical protein
MGSGDPIRNGIIVMELVLESILAYLISLSVNLRTSEMAKAAEEDLESQINAQEELRRAIDSSKPLTEEVRLVCSQLARAQNKLPMNPGEECVVALLSDDLFQSDLVEWLRAGGIEEGQDAKRRMIEAMARGLRAGGASEDQIAFVESECFAIVERAVFENDLLSRWRHQQSLDYLREQVARLKQLAEEGAGLFTPTRQSEVLKKYCNVALSEWDIIDLSNLPEGDIHIATQKLLLRQLYMPMRVDLEQAKSKDSDEALLTRLEKRRHDRRMAEAGHLERVPKSRQRKSGSVGQRIGPGLRTVVLGDPGSGKTTMLRWLATGFLLLLSDDQAFEKLPDSASLPREKLIPVLIRCRDLGKADLCRSFTDFLTQHFRKSTMQPEEAEVMRAITLDRIARGEVLLLIDGLDEITEPSVRMMFCQELERTAVRYPESPIVVTSRIVGYRDMPYRMGATFSHGMIAELSKTDKDRFASTWIEVTEQHLPAPEREKRTEELIAALHSNDRIERLTGTPLLLTTLALVKRKVGKLPNRRNKLYAEAVSVLLNWNPRLYETIEEDEAIPQLEYVAFEMCKQGVQRLSSDELLTLLDAIRSEYPNVRVIRRREPRVFLDLLEARSSILIKSGGIWNPDGGGSEVWEFRHLTFQEYLAGRAILDGRYPERVKAMSLAEVVAALSGSMEPNDKRDPGSDLVVREAWREALRLVVADCNDDVVDEVLLAILQPGQEEVDGRTARPRATLATLCLADEPNVSEETACRVIQALAKVIDKQDGNGVATTPLDFAAVQLGNTPWCDQLKSVMMQEYMNADVDRQSAIGSLWGMIATDRYRSRDALERDHDRILAELNSNDPTISIAAALAIMVAAFHGYIKDCTEYLTALPAFFDRDRASRHAASWAMVWLCGGFKPLREDAAWRPSDQDAVLIVKYLREVPAVERETQVHLMHVLSRTNGVDVIEEIGLRLRSPDEELARSAIRLIPQLKFQGKAELLLSSLPERSSHVTNRAIYESLGSIGDKVATPVLLSRLETAGDEEKKAILRALGRIGDKAATKRLLQMLEVAKRGSELEEILLHNIGQLRDPIAVEPLRDRLGNESIQVRRTVVGAIAKSRGDEREMLLLSVDLDGAVPWIDPRKPIDHQRLSRVARKLKVPKATATQYYREIAAVYKLTVS